MQLDRIRAPHAVAATFVATLAFAYWAARPASGAAGRRPVATTAASGVPGAAGSSAPRVPTFARDVAPIVYANCTSCHRDGEVGPFPLVTAADVRRHAKLIVEVTGRRLMPPWKPADPAGRFKYERRLTDSQVATIARWVAGGTPDGDAADLPPAPAFPAEWDLGPPDLILTVAHPYAVPAEGPDVYVHFVLPPLNLTRDRYLRAVQVLPSNRRAAHHGVPMLDASGTARRRAAAHGGDNYPNFGGPGFIPRGFLPGYAPGMRTRADPASDVGLTLPKGMDVVLQMHYHPTGKPEVDRPRIGLYFTDKKPARNPVVLLLGTDDVDVPAGDATHLRRDRFRLPVDTRVDSVWGHMHMIGKRLHVWADPPGRGRRLELLKIDDWDFNWQETYAFANPLVLPAGTVVAAEFTWDNSAANPRNPNAPPKRVTLGENSTDEMAGLILGGVTVHPADEGSLWMSVLGHYLVDMRRRN